jgi:hypothetical protein
MKLARQLLVGALPARFQTTGQTVDALTEVVTMTSVWITTTAMRARFWR